MWTILREIVFMTLWKQMFEPAKTENVKYTAEEFNQAWNWIFTTPSPPLTLSIIRTKSLALHKARFGCDSGKMACVDVFRNQTQIKAIPARKKTIPARKV